MTTSNLTLSRPAYCERLENFGLAELLRMGQDGSGMAPTTAETTLGITAGDIAAQALELALRGYVTFKRTFTCSTNDTVTLELIARGVTFDAGFVRRLEARVHSVDDAGLASFDRRYIIEGGTTPTVTYFGSGSTTEETMLKGSAGSEVAFDYTRTGQAAAEAQTWAVAAGASTLTFTYTGQSGDVTNGEFEIRVFPKTKITFE